MDAKITRASLRAVGFLVLILGLGLWGRFLPNSFLKQPPRADAQTFSVQRLSGFAWSSNVGWIGFGENGGWPGVEVLPADPGDGNSRRLRGYAWNSNIGWINFAPAVAGAPNETGNGQVGVSPRIKADGSLTGWARACSVFLSGCAGTLLSTSERGGWDGWLSLRGSANDSSDYGVNLQSSGKLTGQAWGADVLGPVDFCNPSDNYCVQINQLDVECQGAVTDDDIAWASFVSGGSGSLTYSWGGVASGSGATAQTNDLLPGTHTASVQVTDQTGAFGEASCSAVVSPSGSAPVTLLVSVIGNGRVGYDNNNKTCPNPSPDCSTTHTFGTQVDFNATPSAGASFVGWSGEAVSCASNPANCQVLLNKDPTVVVARFSRAGGSGPSGSIADEQLIEITRHDLGFPAFSTRKLINNSTAAEIEICLASVESVTDSSSLENILINDGKAPPVCYLSKGGTWSGACDGGNLRATLAALTVAGMGSPGDSEAIFFVKIPEKSLAAREASPYLVTMGTVDSEGVCRAGSGDGWQFEFRYQPFGFVPE